MILTWRTRRGAALQVVAALLVAPGCGRGGKAAPSDDGQGGAAGDGGSAADALADGPQAAPPFSIEALDRARIGSPGGDWPTWATSTRTSTGGRDRSRGPC